MKYNKDDEYKMTKFLRYRKCEPHLARCTFMSLKSIAGLLNRSIDYVHQLSKRIVKDSRKHSNIGR